MTTGNRLKRALTIMILPLLLFALAKSSCLASTPTIVMPHLAFAIDSTELMLFCRGNAEYPVVISCEKPAITAFDTVFIPVRAFCDALQYPIEFSSATGLINISAKEPIVLSQIRAPHDLELPNTYFTYKNIAYMGLETLAKMESSKIVKQDGALFFYSLVQAPSESTHAPFENYDIYFTWQDSAITLNAEFIKSLKSSAVPQKEDYGDYILKRYDINYYKPFVNPYIPYSHAQMVSDASKLAEQYPEYIALGSAGASVEGRDLLTIDFGTGARHIYILGSHHAREYISTSYIMYFLNQTAYSAKIENSNPDFDVRDILSRVTYHIIPMVNPDGVNLVQNGINGVSPALREKVKAMPILDPAKHGYRSWKSNINGVDINRNYPTNWNASKKIRKSSSTTYGGASPASEPETQGVMSYLDKYKSDIVVSVHTQGRWLYWSAPSGKISNIEKRMVASSGYRIDENSLADSKGGYLSNYARDVLKMREITIELCNYKGPFPYPDAQFNEVWQPAKNLLLIAAEEIAK